MRRYARTFIVILVLVVLAAFAVSFKTIKIGNFTRGNDDTLLGLTLGLDLQGGSHLVYEAALFDVMTNELIPPTSDQMASVKRTIERRLNSSGLGEPIVQVLGEDRLLVQIPGVSDPDSAKALIGETAQLEFKRRTHNVANPVEFEQGQFLGFQVVEVTPELFVPESADDSSTDAAEESDASDAESTPAAGGDASEDDGQTTADAGEADAEATPAAGEDGGQTTDETEAPVETGPPGLLLEFDDTGFARFATVIAQMRESLSPSPGARTVSPDRLSLAIEGSAEQEIELTYQQIAIGLDGQVIPIGGASYFQLIPGENKYVVNLFPAFAESESPLADAQDRFGSGTLVITHVQGSVDEDINLTGDDLARAYAGQHQSSGVPIVNIEFNGEGTRKFAEVTTKIAGTSDQIAIFLDDEELIAPVADQAITGGNAFISGRDFTIGRVKDIALLLESGRLPIPIELILEKDIDAILGSDSLEKSVRAGVVGLALVFLFMLLYYRIPGLIAALALLIYSLLLVAVFKMLPVTLTLSGVAAAILSIGMAVDANILIFERMKEEMRAGRTLLSSINIGFNRAWTAIRDSNVSTLITSAILYWFADTLGATVVQGFAATLAIGVMLSMFSAIFVSRTLLRIVALTALGRRLRWYVPTEGKSLPQLQAEAAS